jgi:predicted GTPase
MELSLKSMQYAHVVALVLDASVSDFDIRVTRRNQGNEELLLAKASPILSKTDLNIARRCIDEGRALLLVVNKIDTIPSDQRRHVMKGIELVLQHSLSQTAGIAQRVVGTR